MKRKRKEGRKEGKEKKRANEREEGETRGKDKLGKRMKGKVCKEEGREDDLKNLKLLNIKTSKSRPPHPGSQQSLLSQLGHKIEENLMG